MKFIITILALCMIGYTFAAQGTPAASSYCMGNNDGATTCSACFNWGSGTIGARQLASNACSTKVANTVTDCKFYKGTITSTKSTSDCMVCNNKTYLNIKDHATASSITVACSNTASSTTTCKAAVSNCDQTFCFTNTSSTVNTGCKQCSTGYTGSGTQTSNVGYASCSKTGAITNCGLHSYALKTKCYTCNTGYAVASAETSCTAFTTDANCRMLSSGGSYCKECWHSYYFTTTTCTLAANILALGGMFMFVLAFFN